MAKPSRWRVLEVASGAESVLNARERHPRNDRWEDRRQGDQLLVDVQDGVLVLLPRPQDYTARLTGLHRDIWANLDAGDYLRQERDG